MVRRFVKIAKHCRRLNNFNAVCVCAASRIAAARAVVWPRVVRACVRVRGCVPVHMRECIAAARARVPVAVPLE